MVALTGTVERITYLNQENGYTVIRFLPDPASAEDVVGMSTDGLLTVVGKLPEVSVGERLALECELSNHPRHGVQYRVVSARTLQPITLEGIERYLGSGLIKGIGPALAHRIVAHFRLKTLEIIESEPERLREVSGIGTDRMEKIISAWKAQKQVQDIMLFLHGHQISPHLAVKIYKTYGDQALEVVKRNPYRLEQDIHGVGFKTADRIARNLGLPSDHPSRVEASLIFILNEMMGEGHVYCPETDLIQQSAALLKLEPELVTAGVDRLDRQGRIFRERITPEEAEEPPVTAVYSAMLYHAEKGAADYLQKRLQEAVPTRQGLLPFSDEDLSDEQRAALEQTIRHPVSVITGGPGTGKTTCMKALIQILEQWSLRYALASPTGRAARRLSEAAGRPASTIHRLLGYSPVNGFQYDEARPLAVDFLIVDEASMLDIMLAFQLLRAVKPGTQVLFVGDVDQLPSVGAGDFLRDLIASGTAAVSRLEKIFRQASGSDIITNAHRIQQGDQPVFSSDEAGDFFLFTAETADQAADWVVDLVSRRMPDRFGLHPLRDIQVLSPMYRGGAGVDTLNERLQQTLNPPNPQKVEQQLAGRLFRVGDKVMQIRNNYDKEVFNGDIGMIEAMNRIDQTLTVSMDDQRSVVYDYAEADELVLAYAVSVHKAQGSEFPAVVFPVLTQHYVMLQRNLLYTGITRAEKYCVLVGNAKALRIAINNNQTENRYSNLKNRLKALSNREG